MEVPLVDEVPSFIIIPYWLVVQLVVQSAAVVATVVIEAPKTLLVAVSEAPGLERVDEGFK